ncbi:MAG: transporter, family, 3-phenylpropionic acid transporter [Chloroflexota bacterium]|jgi:PPP family 3-phenylpropionic acid transporter|nr:transporter, family, 3-phenylpropionic acid transporter [Chloroflexota bacterium]
MPLSPSLLARLAYVTVFGAIGATAPFLPVYYHELGIGLGVIPMLGALMAGSGLIGSPLWGAAADRFRGSRLVLPAAALVAALAGLSLAFVGWPALVVVVFVLGIGSSGIGPVLDSRALEAVGADRHRYGRFRVWGSASFVVSAIVVGWLIERTGVRGLFLVYVPLLALTALIGLGLRPRGLVPPMPRLTGVAAVVRSPVLGPFLLAALLTWASSSAINAYFSIYLGQIGAPDSLIGIAWAVGAVVEVPLMIAFPQLARRFGLERLMLVGAGCLLARAVTVVLVRDPILVTSSMLLHGAGFALLIVGGVLYVARHAPVGAAATAQGVHTATAYSLAAILGPTTAGLLAGSFALPQVFAIAGIGSLSGVGALAWAFRSGSRRTASAAHPVKAAPAEATAPIEATPVSPP